LSKKKCHKGKKVNYGFVVAAVGLGLVLAVIIPIWGWILAAGAGLIYLGWYLMNNCGH